MTFAELYTKVAAKVHRNDLTALIPGFVDDARTQINLRLGLVLVPPLDPSETNEILTDWPLLYFYAAMVGTYEFVEEFETATYYIGKWQQEVDRYYITREGTEPLVILTPGEQEAQQP